MNIITKQWVDTLKLLYVIFYKLFRVRPVLAWTVTSFILVISVGLHDGLVIDYQLAIISIIIVILLQSIVSHAVNDLVDEHIDQIANIKGTSRSKVLLEKLVTRSELTLIAVFGIILSTTLALYLLSVRGTYILVFYGFGLLLIYAYNFKPFKLNYRPFGEFKIVPATIMLMTLSMGYVIFGTLTATMFWVGVANSLMNSSWYLFSRLQDVIADNAHNKITTFVLLLRASKFNVIKYVGFNEYATFYVMFFIFILIGISHIFKLIPDITSAILWIYFFIFAYILSNSIDELVNLSSKLRYYGMLLTYCNAILISISLLYY